MSQVTKLEAAHNQMENLIKENEDLRQLNLDQMQAANSGYNKQSFNSTNPLQNELLNELNERVEILMSENALLVEQKSFMNKELDDYQEELTRRTNELNDLSAELLSNQTELSSNMNLLSLLTAERDQTAVRVLEYSDRIGQLESQVDTLKVELSVWQTKAHQVEAGNTELRNRVKEMVARQDQDQGIFMRRTKNAEDRVVELHSQLLQKVCARVCLFVCLHYLPLCMLC